MLPHTVLFRLAFTVRVTFRTPRVSGTGYAHCISRGFTLLSNYMVQHMRAWSLPALLFLSEPVCRSVGRRPEARARGGKATRPHPPWHPSRRIYLGSRRSSARCARTAPDSPFRVVSACHNEGRLINAPQSLKPKGFSVINAPQSLKPKEFSVILFPDSFRAFSQGSQNFGHFSGRPLFVLRLGLFSSQQELPSPTFFLKLGFLLS